jgi:hypothetical protein
MVHMRTLTPLEPDLGFAARGGRPLQRHDTGDRARLDIVGIMIMSIDAFLPVSSTSFSRGNVSAGGWYDDSELSLHTALE